MTHDTDRRPRRSRRLIAAALVALMLEQRYDRITVQAIIDHADIGRSTFYAHYRSKDDVLLQELDRVLDLLHEQHLAHDPPPADQLLPSLPFFLHVHQHAALYAALVRGGAIDLVARSLHRRLRAGAEARLTALGLDQTNLALPPALVADYLAGSYLTLLRWWFEHAPTDPPELMAEVFRRLTSPGIAALLAAAPASRADPPRP